MTQHILRGPLILTHAVLGIAAVAAGQAFVRDPSGRTLGMSPDYLDGSPFPDFRVPGLFLAVVIGTANFASAFALWRGARRAALLSLATGALLLAWIAIQTAIVGFRHWSQALWWLIFTAVTAFAALFVAGERHRDTG